jgi:hypothetical protein
MSERKFRFVSPGVFINEIDNSQLPNQLPDVGPVIIGRAERGPGLVPVRVESPSEFVELYGNPIPGRRGGDVWRDGNFVGPTYGAYAAMGYLRAGVGPITYVRLVGEQSPDATSTNGGEAGWSTIDSSLSVATTPNVAIASNAGAYGLFIAESSSYIKTYPEGPFNQRQGRGGQFYLAAVWHMNSGCSIALSGAIATASVNSSIASGYATTAAAGLPIANVDGGLTFKAIVDDGSETYTTTFDFDKNSSKYIRKVFNTNPQLGNSNHTETSALNNLEDKYWLGQTYDRFVNENVNLSALNEVMGAVVSLQLGGSTTSSDNFSFLKKGFRDPETGWVFSQDTTTAYNGFEASARTQKLFKLIALNHGEWASKSLKVSVKDVKFSTNEVDPYGTFTILVRMASDSDNAPEIVEQYTNCTLNPASENYVAKKIGDRYYSWLEGEKRLRLYGEYDNRSRYVRIEMNESVAAGATDATLLPFGFYGPVKPKDYEIFHGLAGPGCNTAGDIAFKSGSMTAATVSGDAYDSWIGVGRTEGTAGLTIPKSLSTGDDEYGTEAQVLARGSGNYIIAMSGGEGGDHPLGFTTASINFPSLPLRISASDGGLSNIKNAYFGIDTGISRGSMRHDPGYIDYLRPMPGTSHIFAPGTDSNADIAGACDYSWIFTLDDVSGSTGVYVSGSRADGTSLSAVKSSYTGTLDAGFNRFTMPLFGGHDGLDITEQEPFSNKAISGTDERANYELYTVKRAVNTVADPEFVEANILSAPGITNTVITDQLLAVAENRADALAIIDIENVYTPKTETTESFVNRLGTVKTAVDALSARRINSSYACAYYPWVQIRDNISSAALWVPPSVVAIGTFASAEAKAELWFAPAGFSRGGLSDGSAGWPVLSTTERLRREDRDDLYSANINPIASFPSEGIVIFGQKTLQVTPSALDRINVRRLLIFLKKRVSRIASGILFDQNVRTTWTRFKGETDKFLGSVQARLGLTEFRVVLDETTTTPDLIDRNILYAKIFLKPARSIEFIAIDFIITRTGASFDD